ncbi:MAG: PspC domain-containing protein [Pseudomonadales bacterium]|nr:PspC domain-containing protein [Pseudomonadales bacterium]
MARLDRDIRMAERVAKRANRLADRARRRAQRDGQSAQPAFDREQDERMFDGSASAEDYSNLHTDNKYRSRRKSSRRRSRYQAKLRSKIDTWGCRKRPAFGNFYRNRQDKKVLGICSGIAEYFGLAPWKIRLVAVFTLFTIPSLVVPAYFIGYFFIDSKPYYREVADRYQRQSKTRSKNSSSTKQSDTDADAAPEVNNTNALGLAKHKFAAIEVRLRLMETHITSSQFALQNELRNIVGDEG